jgi:hypothetical protein
MDALQFDVALGNRTAAAYDAMTTDGLNQLMGRVSIGAMGIYFSPTSYVDIFAHGGMGVSFDMDIKIDRMEFGYMSWGDTDGLGAATGSAALVTPLGTTKYWMGSNGAGYIGLNNFNLGDATHPAVTMRGTVAIDVVTAHQGIYSVLPRLSNDINTWLMANVTTTHPTYAQGAPALYWGLRFAGAYAATSNVSSAVAILIGSGMSPAYSGVAAGVGTLILTAEAPSYAQDVSVVHISFPDSTVGTQLDGVGTISFKMNVAKIVGEVALGSTPNFATAVGEPNQPTILGDIYLSGFEMRMHTGSWIDIWAH